MLDDKKASKENQDIMAQAIKELLKENSVSLKECAIKVAKEELIAKIKWQIADPVNDCIRNFIQKEIRPEIEKFLVESKPLIVEGLAEIISGIGQSIKDVLAKKAAENIASGYKLDKIIDGLFK
jgi:hypothetical protein